MGKITHYVAFDLEVSGRSPKWHDLMAIAGHVATDKVGGTVCPTFEAYLGDEDNFRYEKGCKEGFWDKVVDGHDGKTKMDLYLERKKEKGKIYTIKEAMSAVIAWVEQIQSMLKDDERAILVSDAMFDYIWLSYHLAETQPADGCVTIEYLIDAEFRVAHGADSFNCGVGGDIREYGTEQIALEALGLTEFPDTVEPLDPCHDPLKDAKRTSEIAAFIVGSVRKRKRAHQ